MKFQRRYSFEGSISSLDQLDSDTLFSNFGNQENKKDPFSKLYKSLNTLPDIDFNEENAFPEDTSNSSSFFEDFSSSTFAEESIEKIDTDIEKRIRSEHLRCPATDKSFDKNDYISQAYK